MEMDPNLKEIINDTTNRWLFVGGKGGVGKTTTSCSIAVKIAQSNPNKNILLISTDPAHNTSDTFNQIFTHEPTPVEGLKNLSVMEIDAKRKSESQEAAQESGDTDSGSAPRGSALEKLCSSMPGMDEAMAYAAVIKLVNSLDFDRIIFDTAPTGHTLRLLDFPNVVDKAIKKFDPIINLVKPMLPMMEGMMQNMQASNSQLAQSLGIDENVDIKQVFDQLEEVKPLIQQIKVEFKDPSKTSFICVCIAEFLSLYETERLIQRLMELEIDSSNIVINQLMPEEENEDTLDLFFKFREKLQTKYLGKYDDLYGGDFNIVHMPLQDHEIRGQEKLNNFSKLLVNSPDPAKSLQEPVIDNKALKWVFVGGKGGVGKTTCSCSLAIEMAKVRKNVLLISTDPAHNTSDAFNQKFTKEPTKVVGYDNLFCMEITPDFNISKMPDSVLEDSPEEDQENKGFLGIGKKFITDLLAMSPGIDEAVAYYEIWRLVEKLSYDCIIFDTAPTGHTLRLLNFPTVMENAILQLKSMKDSLSGMTQAMSMLGDTGGIDFEKLYEQCEKFLPAIQKVRNEFQDPEQTTFVGVCIAEFLSLYETERLIQELMKLDIDCSSIIINQLVVNSQQKEGLMRFRRKIQNTYLTQYDDLYGEDFHLCKVPLIDDEIRGVDKLAVFSKNLEWLY